MWTLEVAFSKYNHAASKGSLIIYKYFIITDINLHSVLLFVCRYVYMCALYVHICVSAPRHVSAPVCAQMHICTCARGQSKIGCDVYFASGDRVSHWCVHRCTCVYVHRGHSKIGCDMYFLYMLFVTGLLGVCTDAHMFMCYVHRGHSKIGWDVYFAFCDRSLTGLGLTDLGRPAGHWALRNPPVSASPELDLQDQVCLFSWVLGSNSGPHACKAHTLLTVLSLCPFF